MTGRMGNRHIDIVAAFMTEYGVPDRELYGKRILDIGCWPRGTCLLLAAMGADVFAIDEVHKYVDCVRYLKNAFSVDNLQVEARSLYSLDSQEFQDRFDIVLYSGVLYHVTDPVLSLRSVFNCLKDGGLCLLETMAILAAGSKILYAGAHETLTKATMEGPPGGWNWFVPLLEATCSMMKDVGFEIQRATLHEDNRLLALGRRDRHVDMLRAGLSNRSIR